MKESMEELIHHFKLFTEGMHVPPGRGVRGDRASEGRVRDLPHVGRGNKPWRLKIRAPGFPHLAAMDELARGT
jgi:NADH-quinone oxidoreductase subunit D